MRGNLQAHPQAPLRIGASRRAAAKPASSVAPLVTADCISSPKIGHSSLAHRGAEIALLSFNHPSPATYRTEISEDAF
jgi:hypothetical protein